MIRVSKSSLHANYSALLSNFVFSSLFFLGRGFGAGQVSHGCAYSVDSLASFIFLDVETSEQHDGLVLEQSAIHGIWRIYRSTELS
jgi:hypothetical protein